MPANVDERFYERADAMIHLANDQMQDIGRGKVSASFLYGAARFNVYNSACNCDSGTHMQQERESIRDYYIAEYGKILDEHLDDYIENYDRYMTQREASE